eukprot:s3285_g3.t1
MPLSIDTFHQRDGRCKIVDSEQDEALQCSADQVARWEAKQKQERSVQYQKGRVQQSQLQEAMAQVDKFLQHHGIHSDSYDVKVAKKLFGGLCRTYPLHLAAKERAWHMVSAQTPCSWTAAEELLTTAWGNLPEWIRAQTITH